MNGSAPHSVSTWSAVMLSHFVAGFQFDSGQRITNISVGVAGCMSENLTLYPSWELLHHFTWE